MTNVQEFYTQNPLKVWKKVLGPSMHYHFGGDDAVRELYSYIDKDSTLLDVGCGWSGPAKLLREERNISIDTLSNSEQHQPTYLCDIHSFIPTKQYHTTLFFESLTHFDDAPTVLNNLRAHTNQIVIRDFTMQQDGYHKEWNMYIRTPPSWYQLLSSQYEITHLFVTPTNQQIVETCKYWYDNILTLPFNQMHGHILLLRQLCEHVLQYGSPFNSITIVAK